jgi:hypothetical protein
MRTLLRAAPVLLAGLLAAAPAAALARAKITVVNANAPGIGFNDPTPATPLATNPGTTVGQQRLNAFQFVASFWGKHLDSEVEIFVQASFEPLSCTATAAVLGSAGTLSVFRDFPNAKYPGTWYPVALANKIAGEDLDPAAPGYAGNDLRARFNSNLGQPTCLAGSGWYYGLDTNQPANQINLVVVLLHEFAHGLGFASFASGTTGALFAGYPDVYSRFYFDNSTGKARLDMTDLERTASAVNSRNVVWTGEEVTEGVREVLQRGTPFFTVTAPASIAGRYFVGTASFGPALTAAGVSGPVALAKDAGGSTLGCNPLGAGALAGKIALVDRGTCTFTVKARNAQDAGAIALVVADNAPSALPAGLGGTDPLVTIPAVRITQAAGAAIKGALPGVDASLLLDLKVRAGADPAGRALLYTPNPYESGSSVSHWDTSATPNQLMEPAINADLTISVSEPKDLTKSLLEDIGWDDEGKKHERKKERERKREKDRDEHRGD